MIKMIDLKKSYKNRMVVDIKSLHIPENQIFGIIGGNGSGKTTLLKMIAELEQSDSGMIDKNMQLHELVYLFQKPHLFNTSVYNNIAYPLKFRKVSKDVINIKVKAMIDLFGLENIMHQNALKLSGGEAQKVNLARALVFGPKLILLDEPTANIDTKSTMQIESILKSLDISIILVTHNLNQASRMCEKVAIMCEGEILEVSHTEEALKHKSLQYI